MNEKELQEMEALIAQVESEGLLHAPKNMKQEITQKCMKLPIPYSSKRSLYTYAVKIGVGVAAALLLLFSINTQQMAALENVKQPKTRVSVATQITDGLNDLSSLISIFTNNLVKDGGNKNDK
ncbi:MAG: hypothetical protein RR364_09235 [Lachnospiraceae bacterium]